MASYFLRVATPVEKTDCMKALVNAWSQVFHERPKDDAVRLLCAHTGIETGWGTKGYCYNLTNIRTSKYDYTYISGNEKINGQWVYFDADHPSDNARFRAFRTPQDFADAYIDLLSRMHQGSVAVLRGSCDPVAFCHALHASGFYTDDVDHYTSGFVQCHNMVKSMPVPPAGEVTGYPVLAPDPRGDPLTWPATPAPVDPPPAAPTPAQPWGDVVAWMNVRPTRDGEPVHLRVERGTLFTPPSAPRRGGRTVLVELDEVLGRDGPEAREAALWDEIRRGNIPSFVQKFAPVVLTDRAGHRATLQVSVDFVAIGTEDDWLRVPLSGYNASRVAEAFGCSLPTNKVVLEAYRQASIKLVAHPFDCQSVGGGKYQRSNLAWMTHEDVIQGKIPCKPGPALAAAAGRFDPWLGRHEGVCALAGPHPGVLVSGHKKEVILSHEDLSKHLAFWGFFSAAGKAIQSGFGCRHGPGYSDYSHGVRLVKVDVDLDGRPARYPDLLADPAYAELMLDHGAVCPSAAYPEPPATFYMGS